MSENQVIEMRRRSTDDPGAQEARRVDDKIELVRALIEAERRNAEAYQKSTEARLERLEETQSKILRRVLLWAGGLLVLSGLFAFVLFVLEWIGPTAIRKLINAAATGAP